MVLGKTHSSSNLADVFSRYSELDILRSYFDIKRLPCLIKSPLRTDKNPSFSVYLDKNKRVKFTDFATGEHGDILDLLGLCWGCSFPQVISRLCSDFMVSSSPRSTISRTSNNIKVDCGKTNIEVKVRGWLQRDIDYWESYGVTLEWLKYAEVYPISHKIVAKMDSNNRVVSRMAYKAEDYAYVFVEHKDKTTQLKIYQPFNTNGFKWCSKMDRSVISLWTKIPEIGDRVVICSSLKDALCLMSQLHIPAIAPQGEGYSISNTAVKELKRRFKRVFICYDMDKAGIDDSKKLSQRTGFTSVFPNLGNTKDLSDYYKSLLNKGDFQQLKTLFQ